MNNTNDTKKLLENYFLHSWKKVEFDFESEVATIISDIASIQLFLKDLNIYKLIINDKSNNTKEEFILDEPVNITQLFMPHIMSHLYK